MKTKAVRIHGKMDLRLEEIELPPVVIFYLCCQKYIIKGVAAGAVKG